MAKTTHEGHAAHTRAGGSRPGGETAIQAEAVDPVCGITVDPATSEYRSDHKGKTYFFCSSGCNARFNKQPDMYLVANKGAG